MIEQEPVEGRLAGSRFFDRLPVVSALIFASSMGLSLALALLNAPVRRPGWTLAVMLALAAASTVLFWRIFWRFIRDGRRWPMPWRLGWSYFGGQLLILAALLAFSDAFVVLTFALTGQVFGVLRPRHWALPLVPLVALLAGPLGWADAIGRADWSYLAGVLLLLGIWMVVGAMIALLLHQRYQLLCLVAELRAAKLQIEALLQTAREALVNFERHAAARRVAMKLVQENGCWRLELVDDGVGVRPAELEKPGHYGIVGMRERLTALGGTLAITARPEGGTRVVATIPDSERGEA